MKPILALICALLLSACAHPVAWYFGEESRHQYGPMETRKADAYWQKVYPSVAKNDSEIKVVHTSVFPQVCYDIAGHATALGCSIPATKTVYINPSAIARFTRGPYEYAKALICAEGHEKAEIQGWRHKDHLMLSILYCAPEEGYVTFGNSAQSMVSSRLND